MAEIAELLTRLDKVTGKYPKWSARCPAHMDRSPSLGIRQLDDGKILINCLAGCGAVDVMDAIGMSLSDLFPADNGRHDWRKERDKKKTIEDVERIAFAKEVALTYQIQQLKKALDGQTTLRNELKKAGVKDV